MEVVVLLQYHCYCCIISLDFVISEWTGKRLLTMAGVFDVWHPPDVSCKSVERLKPQSRNLSL